MATNHTTNYNLNLWAPTDKFVREEFNENSTKIDAAIKAVDTKADGKADSSTVTALAQTVNTKASQTALNALTQTVNGKGNCRIVTGSYVGAGKVGSSYPNTLTFDKPPLLVIVYNGLALLLKRGDTTAGNINGGTSTPCIWNGNSVSWYCSSTEYGPNAQLNSPGTVYRYIAFLEA